MADTIFHEALHATARSLGRHAILPEYPQDAESHLEELAVYVGLNSLYSLLRIPQMRNIHRCNKACYAKLKADLVSGLPGSLILDAQQHGVNAADYLFSETQKHIVQQSPSKG